MPKTYSRAWRLVSRLGFWLLLGLGLVLITDGATGGHLTALGRSALLQLGWLRPELVWTPGN